ncbi:hypothetical protein [Cupriavidus sp. BIC8F]|uniref:hypothetical protein n=1 Tax=Cupriavidus sp. BIC8F TaxID=3079014 RepID=UPI0029160767|nr:hypothetical protein [Cupriavidus sp. BIC8F]
MNRLLTFTSKHFLKLCFAFWVFGISQSIAVAIRDNSLDNFLSWRLTQYYVNYFDFGFVKRGLLGTLLYPIFHTIGGNKPLAVAMIILLDFAIVFGGLALIKIAFDRESRFGTTLKDVIKCLIVFSPVGIMQLSYDAGRFDHVNMILVMASLVLMLKGHNVLAGVLLGLGVLVHEAVFVFGLPVLLAIGVATNKHKPIFNIAGALLKPAVIPSVCAISVAILGNSDVSFAAALPPGFDRGSMVWQRGLLEPATNLSLIQYAVLAFYALTPCVFLTHFYRSNALRLDLVFFATLSTFALFALGTDYARWCQLILFSNLIVVVFHSMSGKSDLKITSRMLNFLFILYALPLGPIGVDSVLPYVDVFSRRVLGF